MPRRVRLIVPLLLVAVGCSAKSGPAVPKVTTLGVVLPLFGHPFFAAQREGLEREAKRLGVAIDVRDGQDDDQKQIAQVQALIRTGCAAIILCPRDEDALVAAVEAANRAKIPVITLNRRVRGGRVVTYVGADDADGGQAQGEDLIRALGAAGGKVIYFQGTPGSSPQIARNKGFHQAIDAHPEIVIAADQFTDFQEDKAKAAMTGLARRFPKGEIRAIVAQADELALPAAEVARAQGWDDVVVIGFNGTKGAFDAIQAGKMRSTILQDSAEQGRLAVSAAVDHLAGKSIPDEIITPLPLIDAKNAGQFRPSY